MTEANVPSYAHNLVSALYTTKELLENLIPKSQQSVEILQRVCGQANQALAIAKRLEAASAALEFKLQNILEQK